MADIHYNPAVVRLLIIVGFLILSQFLRSSKKQPPKTSPKPPSSITGKPQPLDLFREVLQQARQQAEQQRRGTLRPDTTFRSPIPLQPPPNMPGPDEFPMQVSQRFPVGEQFQAPPAIQPESSFLPSLLLLALLACLVVMAYQYFAR